MDKLLAQYLVTSLEMLENHTVSQIRALKGLVLSAQASPKEKQVVVQGEKVDTETVEKRLEDWMSDLAGVKVGEFDDSDIRESEETDR